MENKNTVDVGIAGLIILAGTGASMFAGFLLRILLARNLNSAEFGTIILFLSILNTLSIITLLGLNRGVVKFTSSNRSNEELRNSYITISLLIPLIVSICLGITLYLSSSDIIRLIFNQNTNATIINFLAISLPFYTSFKIISATLRGTMYTKIYSLYNKIIEPWVKILAVLSAILVSATAHTVAAGLTTGFMLVFMGGISILYKTGWRPTLSYSTNIQELTTYSIPVLLASSIYVLLTYFDKIFIGIFLTPEAVGKYEIAITLAALLSLFNRGFSFLVFPKISEAVELGNTSVIDDLYQQTTKWILLFTTPLILIMIYRPYPLVILFGENYSAAEISPILGLLAIGFFINAIVGPNSDALLGLGQTKAILKYNILAVIVNVILNILLIPRYELIGAAIASLVGYFLLNLLKSGNLYFYHGVKVVNKKSLLMAFSVFSIGSLIASSFPSTQTVLIEFSLIVIYSALSMVIGILILWRLKGITDDDKKIVRRVFKMILQISKFT